MPAVRSSASTPPPRRARRSRSTIWRRRRCRSTFLAQAQDDPIAPVDNSLLMFGALRRLGVPAEMHIFAAGKHGWGMGKPDSLVHAWPGLFTQWAAFNQFFKA